MDTGEQIPVQVVGAAIVDDLTRPTTLLSGRRSVPASLAGSWELPGGKVEPGERPQDGLRREVREELGVEVELGARVEGPLGGAWQLGNPYVMQVWLARVICGDPSPLQDHDQLRVLTRAELYEVSWLPGDLPIIAALAALMG
jgi:8-oxo-dGTP diphosphatase